MRPVRTFPILALSGPARCDVSGADEADFTTYDDLDAFLAGSDAVVRVTYPSEESPSDEPYVESGVTFACRNGVADYTRVLPGRELTLSGNENCGELLPGVH